MGLNTAREGHVHPSYAYEVAREKVREYARATGVDDPAIDDDEPGTPTPCPPTFLAVVTARALPTVVEDPELGATWDLLHTAQSLELHRTIRVGDVLTCTPRVARVVARGRMDLLEFSVDVADHDGTPVASTTTTLMVFDRDADASDGRG